MVPHTSGRTTDLSGVLIGDPVSMKKTEDVTLAAAVEQARVASALSAGGREPVPAAFHVAFQDADVAAPVRHSPGRSLAGLRRALRLALPIAARLDEASSPRIQLRLAQSWADAALR